MAKPNERQGRGYFLDDDSEEEAGVPWNDFIIALHVWSWMRPSEKQATVREASDQFGVTDDVVRMAVRQHPWMLLCGPPDDPAVQYIDHDGT